MGRKRVLLLAIACCAVPGAARAGVADRVSAASRAAEAMGRYLRYPGDPSVSAPSREELADIQGLLGLADDASLEAGERAMIERSIRRPIREGAGGFLSVLVRARLGPDSQGLAAFIGSLAAARLAEERGAPLNEGEAGLLSELEGLRRLERNGEGLLEAQRSAARSLLGRFDAAYSARRENRTLAEAEGAALALAAGSARPGSAAAVALMARDAELTRRLLAVHGPVSDASHWPLEDLEPVEDKSFPFAFTRARAAVDAVAVLEEVPAIGLGGRGRTLMRMPWSADKVGSLPSLRQFRAYALELARQLAGAGVGSSATVVDETLRDPDYRTIKVFESGKRALFSRMHFPLRFEVVLKKEAVEVRASRGPERLERGIIRVQSWLAVIMGLAAALTLLLLR